MAGNRKINNQEQLASVRAKLNDNFEELSNMTTQLQPLTGLTGANADGFVRSRADGTFDTVVTAPPDGGLGGNSFVQADSNFNGKLPDYVVLPKIQGGSLGSYNYRLSAIIDTSIYFIYWTGSTSYYIEFNNDATGSNPRLKGATAHTTDWSFDGATSLQELIDAGRAVYHGQKSGTSGIGNLGVIQAQTSNFYTELPDSIVAIHKGGFETILRLKFARSDSIAGTGNGRFYYEARVDPTGTGDYLMLFNDDTDGTFYGHAGTDNYPADGSMDQSLRWFINNGRALYYGGDGQTGEGLGENFEYQTGNRHTFPGTLPDKIILASGTTPIAFQLAFVSTTQIAYYDTRADGKRYMFNADGTHNAATTDTNYIPFEGAGAGLQDIIDGGHAVYHGKR